MIFHIKWQRPQNFSSLNAIVNVLCMMNSNSTAMWIMIHLNQSTLKKDEKKSKTTKTNSIYQLFLFSPFLFIDDRRRGTRIRPTEDNRRHTLGHTNDMHAYSQQNQNLQQRAMDLEVNILSNLRSFMTNKQEQKISYRASPFVQWSWIFHCASLTR